mmetsp:Transcript_19986/g.55261  ORF Transcript_19986/g.55261 Transcript_19986/m.55261 type:complete len:277 (-) Transcript_19986:131-961(-)
MDVNLDRLALRCFNKILEEPDADAGVEAAVPATRQHALLLKAIALLNEAQGSPETEVSECLEVWLQRVPEAAGSGLDQGTSLIDRISQLRQSKGAEASADLAVAMGVLRLLSGVPSAPTFADALRAPEDDGSLFGMAALRAMKWNMLGAVLANAKRYQHALVAYGQALALQPYYPRVLVNRGIAFAQLGQHLQAAATCARAIEIVPAWSAPAIWPQLQKAADDQSSMEELAEVVRNKNLVRALELLKPSLCDVEPATAEEPVVDVLARIDLAGPAP